MPTQNAFAHHFADAWRPPTLGAAGQQRKLVAGVAILSHGVDLDDGDIHFGREADDGHTRVERQATFHIENNATISGARRP